jgi:predicted aspartyl protease
MGEVRVKVKVSNPIKEALVKLKAIKSTDFPALVLDCLVDTGAVMVLLAEDVVHRLGLEIGKPAVVTLANDQTVEMKTAGPVTIEIEDRSMPVNCLVGPPLCEPLIGQLVLEGLDLIVDCQRQQLTFRPSSPAYPSYKLK